MAGEIVIFAYETQKNDFFLKRGQVSRATGTSKFGLIEFQTRSYGYLGAYRAGFLFFCFFLVDFGPLLGQNLPNSRILGNNREKEPSKMAWKPQFKIPALYAPRYP